MATEPRKTNPSDEDAVDRVCEELQGRYPTSAELHVDRRRVRSPRRQAPGREDAGQIVADPDREPGSAPESESN